MTAVAVVEAMATETVDVTAGNFFDTSVTQRGEQRSGCSLFTALGLGYASAIQSPFEFARLTDGSATARGLSRSRWPPAEVTYVNGYLYRPGLL